MVPGVNTEFGPEQVKCASVPVSHRIRVLRRKDSRYYFRGDGWTADPAEARVFASAMQAAQTCAELGLITGDGLLAAELVWQDPPAAAPVGRCRPLT